MCLQDADSEGAKAYEKAAEATDDIPFATTADDDVFAKFEVSKDSVVLFKKVTLKFLRSCPHCSVITHLDVFSVSYILLLCSMHLMSLAAHKHQCIFKHINKLW